MRATRDTRRRDYLFHQCRSDPAYIMTTSSRAREEVTSKELEAAKAAEETNRVRLQLGLEQQKVTDAEVSHDHA